MNSKGVRACSGWLSKSTLPSSFNVVSKNVDDLFNEDDDSEVEEVYDETATYMASTSININKASKSGSGGGKKSLYEQWKENHGEDLYEDDDFDNFDDPQMKTEEIERKRKKSDET
ncbi:hypothetical protein Tco_1194883 [Tanacetum coccineum]